MLPVRCGAFVKKEWKRIGDFEIAWWLNQYRRVVLGGDGHRENVGRIWEPHICENGYIRASFAANGQHQEYLHEWVALIYLGPCPRGKEVNHKDGNKLNNDPRNLEYVTHKQNFEHAVKNGLRLRAYPNYGIRNGNAKLTVKKVRKIKRL